MLALSEQKELLLLRNNSYGTNGHIAITTAYE